MTCPFHLALIQNSFLPLEFRTIAERARQHGFTVTVYADNAAFLADAAAHPHIDALLCMGNTPCDSVLLERMPRLRALLSAVTGVEGFDLAAATRAVVIVGNGQTEKNTIGMAESTILLMLAALYDFSHTQRVLRDNLGRPSPLRARLLHGLTVGMVGFGKIAQETARRLAPWGITLLVAARRPDPLIEELGGVQTDLETVLRRSDIVSLHCSLNAQTRHIIDRERLALMKPGAILVNTSRGALVEEAALIEALRDRRIAGAALDTFETEPLPLDNPLRQFDHVVLTPHMVGHTADCNATLTEAAWETITRISRGEPPVFVKNPEVLPSWLERLGRGAV